MNQTPAYSLEGKRVLITGSARRIGRSIALALARTGADLVIHYGTSLAEAESLQNEIETIGSKAELIHADLNDQLAVAEIIPQALFTGPLYGLVNNASIFEPLDWKSTRIEDWNRNLMVNLTAPFLLCQAFAQSIPPGNSGRIINMLDWRALRPGSDHLPYTISKAALAALTQSLAQALAPQITVNGLALGAILPPAENPDTSWVSRVVPAKRWANLEEVNQAALFLLAGPDYITGEILHVDGGMHLV